MTARKDGHFIQGVNFMSTQKAAMLEHFRTKLSSESNKLISDMFLSHCLQGEKGYQNAWEYITSNHTAPSYEHQLAFRDVLIALVNDRIEDNKHQNLRDLSQNTKKFAVL